MVAVKCCSGCSKYVCTCILFSAVYSQYYHITYDVLASYKSNLDYCCSSDKYNTHNLTSIMMCFNRYLNIIKTYSITTSQGMELISTLDWAVHLSKIWLRDSGNCRLIKSGNHNRFNCEMLLLNPYFYYLTNVRLYQTNFKSDLW